MVHEALLLAENPLDAIGVAVGIFCWIPQFWLDQEHFTFTVKTLVHLLIYFEKGDGATLSVDQPLDLSVGGWTSVPRSISMEGLSLLSKTVCSPSVSSP